MNELTQKLRVWNGFIRLGAGSSSRFCEHVNEPQGPIKWRKCHSLPAERQPASAEHCSMMLVHLISHI
jgi:hypothetical protein